MNINKITQNFIGTYTCFGTNYLGYGNNSLLVTVTGAPPYNMTISSPLSTSVIATWEKPAGSLSDSLIHYNLKYWTSSNGGVVIEMNVTTTTVTIIGLEEYTLYVYEVRAIYEQEIVSVFISTNVTTLQDGEIIIIIIHKFMSP